MKLVCYPRYQFLTWEGGDKRKRKWRGVGEGGWLFEGGNFYKYFGQKEGDYLSEAINRGMAIIRVTNLIIYRFVIFFSFGHRSLIRNSTKTAVTNMTVKSMLEHQNYLTLLDVSYVSLYIIRSDRS